MSPIANIFDRLTARDNSSAKDAEEDTLAPDSVSGKSDKSNAYINRRIKDAVQELLKHGLLEASKKSHLYQTLITEQKKVAHILEPLDLQMRIDDVRGLAFVCVADMDFAETTEDEWSHPLVRRQRLNLEQSLLIALLRQHFVAHEMEAGIGASQAQIDLDDLLPQLQAYLGDLGSDTRERARLHNLLEKLKGHGIVSEIDQHDQIVIRPIIAHMANPENLTNLLQAFRDQAAKNNV